MKSRRYVVRALVTSTVVLSTAAGCEADSGSAETATPAVTRTAERALGTDPAPDPTIAETTTPTSEGPAAGLVGVWGRTTDTMEVVIRFLPDGRYRSVEIYTPLEAAGVYQLQRVEDGLAEIRGGRMRLTGRTATLKRTALDDEAGDYEKSTPPRSGAYTWELDGDELHLTDAGGKDAIFTRQQ